MMFVAPTVTRTVRSLVSDDSTVLIERVDSFERDGRSVQYEIAVGIELDPEGRIKRWRGYHDLESIVSQLVAVQG
jgi:limonene-1,2-epoxide hydrolase